MVDPIIPSKNHRKSNKNMIFCDLEPEIRKFSGREFRILAQNGSFFGNCPAGKFPIVQIRTIFGNFPAGNLGFWPKMVVPSEHVRPESFRIRQLPETGKKHAIRSQLSLQWRCFWQKPPPFRRNFKVFS